jgi:hypothetical protein
MLWVYQEYYDIEPTYSIGNIIEEFNDPGMLAEMYPHAIYFYADLAPIED